MSEEARLRSLIAWLLAGWKGLYYQEISSGGVWCPKCGRLSGGLLLPHEPDCRINEAEEIAGVELTPGGKA